jgi:hydroxyacyl-ACP dehydratase HTD2-like protein with hotdog domain
LAVSQVHGGARVEVTALPAAGTVIHSCRELVDAEHKYGSSGDLVILKLRTCFTDGAGRALSTYIESLVVRTPQTGRGSSSSPKPSKPRGELVLTWTPSRVQLFRFSAVTWNAHRVHYDLEHAHREGFPDVLVHSTLQAEMLAQASLTASERRGRSRVRAIEWRNLAPACAGTPLRYFVDIHEKDHVAVTAVDPCDQPRASAMVTVTSEEL